MRTLFLLLLVPVVLGGCASLGREALPLADSRVARVWPAPPETARISMLRVLSGPGDILPERTKFQRMLESVTGEQQVYIGLKIPAGVAADGEGLIYIADPAARLVHRYDFKNREVDYLSQGDGEHMVSPVGVALDRNGNCYVTDSVLAKVFKFGPNDHFLGFLGNGKVAFQRPAGIAVTDAGKKYVVDVLAHKLIVFDQNDNYLGDFPAAAYQKELALPISVAVDHQGFVYVTDASNFDIRVFDDAGRLVRTIGQIGDTPGSFARPKGVAIDSDGHVYTVDANFDNFQIFDQQGRFLMYVGKTGHKPGEFYLPNGIFIDQKDRIYVSDSYNRRIQIFQYLKQHDTAN